MDLSRNVKGVAERLQKFCIAVAGCGGLGSNIAVSLVRTGVKRLKLADFDNVEECNLNRQHFFLSDVDRPKSPSLAAILRKINPEVELEVFDEKLVDSNVGRFFDGADFLIEAFDSADAKLWLIDKWSELYPDKPIVCGSGVAGIGNFEDIRVRKIGNIYLCGDGKSDASEGFIAPKVAIVAQLEAMTAVKIMMESVVK